MNLLIRRNKRVGILSIVIGSVLLVVAVGAHAQIANRPDETGLPPINENFRPAFDLVSPWRSSGCESFACGPDEKVVTVKEFAAAHRLTIYKRDGSPWYTFSVSPKENDYFLRQREVNFRPFATFPGPDNATPDAVILRMTGESANWYEIEIDESTRETKYVLKSDPMWARTTWDYWLLRRGHLEVDGDKVKLLEKPIGRIIDASSDLAFKRVRFIKADGDWAFVEGAHDGKYYRGWIRWRDGRTILVGLAFNYHKVP